MKTIGMWFLTATMVVLSLGAEAQVLNPPKSFKGFVRVRPNRELYTEIVAPQPGKPTVVLLNGLTYSLRQFDSYANELIKRGIGVVRFDFEGMGQTLLRYGATTGPIMIEQQVKDLHTLLYQIKLPPPYNFVGLSYGGGAAIGYSIAFPREIGKLILIAPYMEPLAQQDSMIKSQIAMTRATFPGNPASDDELYDFFLKQIVFSTYPMLEPIVLENQYKLEAVYNLVRGIRKFRPMDYARILPAGTVHLMQSTSDQYIPTPVYLEFWNKTNPAAKMSRIRIFGVEHKMTEKLPELTAAWTWQILKGNPLLKDGNDFDAFALTGRVTFKGKVIPLQE